jgi:hypothetical protein
VEGRGEKKDPEREEDSRMTNKSDPKYAKSQRKRRNREFKEIGSIIVRRGEGERLKEQIKF